MLRKTLIAVAAAAALTLASCSSTAGTAQTGGGDSPGSASAGSDAAGAGGTGSAGADQPESPNSDVEAVPNSNAGSSAGSDAGGDADPDSDSGGGVDEGSDSTATTITAGGDIEGQSAAWFSAFCTGIGPAFTSMMGVDFAAEGAAKQTAYVTAMNGMADAFSATASLLSTLPPPTITNGDKLASTAVNTFRSAAPTLKQAASAIAAVDPTDEQALQDAIDKANEQADEALSSMDQIDLDEETQQKLREIPACKMFTVTDDGASPGSAPTTG